jgi:putative transposase
MARYRLLPTPAQEAALRDHCAQARYVWNLAVEQNSHWHPGRTSAPGYLEQCLQLTEARAEFVWLRAGSQTVQQQALRDFAQALKAFFDPQNPAGRPSWRKADRDEGFRITGRGPQWDVRRVSRHVGQVWVPKVGWVRFRWSRAVPPGVKSYRVTMDRAGRWHIAFAAIPAPVPAPANGEVIGVDRGVAVAAALSTGEMLHVPGLTTREQRRMRRLERKLARAKRGSERRKGVRLAIARLRARETDRRKDWAEKVSTDLARRFDVIRVEHLQIENMTRSAKGTAQNPGRNVRVKAGLNRGILRSGWGLLVRRLEDKAPGRVEKIKPAFTSQRCSACGQVDGRSRESQARFLCTVCGFAGNADVNAARNIAAGHAVTARGGFRDAGPVNRELQLLTSLTGRERLESSAFRRRRVSRPVTGFPGRSQAGCRGVACGAGGHVSVFLRREEIKVLGRDTLGRLAGTWIHHDRRLSEFGRASRRAAAPSPGRLSVPRHVLASSRPPGHVGGGAREIVDPGVSGGAVRGEDLAVWRQGAADVGGTELGAAGVDRVASRGGSKGGLRP